MKKTDTERLKKIVSLWDALSSEIERRGITREMLLTEQFSQWAVTTPVYNIGEQSISFRQSSKRNIQTFRGALSPGCGIGWCMIMTVSTGH